MSITLSNDTTTLTLPQGLRWSDEHAWSAVAIDAKAIGLTGAPLIQIGIKTAGRPMTLIGGRAFAWMTRAELTALRTLLHADDANDVTAPADLELTITLHDGRAFRVIPDHTGAGPITAGALPIVRDSGPADPPETWNYVIDELRFLILDTVSV